jgi:hypothetical protein
VSSVESLASPSNTTLAMKVRASASMAVLTSSFLNSGYRVRSFCRSITLSSPIHSSRNCETVSRALLSPSMRRACS